MRIGTRLIAVTTAVVILVFAAGGLRMLRHQEGFFLGLEQERALQASALIRRALSRHMLENKRRDLEWIVAALGGQEGILSLSVFDEKGRIAFSSRPETVGTRVGMDSPRCAHCHPPGRAPLRSAGARLLRGSNGGRVVTVMEPIRNEPACRACHPRERAVLGTLEVSLSFAAGDRLLAASKRETLLLLGGLLLAVAASLSLFMHRQVGLPLRRLREATIRVASGDFALIPPPGGGEFSELSSSFNRMTRQLQEARSRLEEWNRLLAARVARATEELREANRRLRGAYRAKSRFARDMAHELKGSLAAAETCLAAVCAGCAEDARTREDLIRRALGKIRALRELVRDLLHLASAEETGSAKREPLSVVRAAAHAADALREKAWEKGVRLETRIPDSLPPLWGARLDLETALVNLLDNAVKYSRPGGTVLLRAAAEGEHILLEVIDEGIGIPASELPELFHEFFRGEAARRHAREGTGLGLSIVRRTVEGLGGGVEVSSEPGKGSRFILRFPIGKTEA